MIPCSFCLRRAFLESGVPVHLRGIGGPSAPHVFEMDVRENLGYLAGSNWSQGN